MNDGQPFCKISGNAKIEKIKERIWRIQLNAGSLENTLKTLTRILSEFQKPQNQRDDMVLEALTFYAVIEYTKCFNSDFSDTLDPSIFSDQLPNDAGPNDLSVREFHSMVMNYRNAHLAHSGRLLKVAETGGIRFPNGNFGIGPVVATRAYREDFAFYNGLNSLTTLAIAETSRRMEAAQQKLIESVRLGEATITSDAIQLVPVSDQVTPREMWGLPPRSS